MAVLKELRIQHFRNLDLVNLTPSFSFNIIFGSNASGKTSILEAIHILSSNRSFRTNNLQYVIQSEKEQCSLYTRLEIHSGHSSSSSHKLGLSRNRSKHSQFRIDGQSVARASELAILLPVIAIEPASFDLIDGAPSYRRSLLDWLVFHVKHGFLEASRNYHKVLKQRNILLRSGKIDHLMLQQWDRLLIDAAMDIERMRKPVLANIQEELHKMLSKSALFSGLHLSLEYKSGWGTDHDVSTADRAWYEAKLSDSLESDLLRGSTQLGSHRQDIKIKTGQGKASEFLSRGQKKAVILAIYLCLARLLNKHQQKSPVFLLDDLPSELDRAHLTWLCAQLHELQAQVFISSVELNPLVSLDLFSDKTNLSYKAFHVKHGAVEEFDSEDTEAFSQVRTPEPSAR